MERKLNTTEEQRRLLEQHLNQEKETRELQTQLRVLTNDEKNLCKECVQELLAAAKDSLDLTLNEDAALVRQNKKQQTVR